MIKIAMIGAGSVVFSKNLTGDILSYPEFRNATFSYMDVDRERLEVGAEIGRADQLEDHVERSVVLEALGVEDLVGAELRDRVAQVGVAHGGGDVGAGGRGELHGRGADAAGRQTSLERGNVQATAAVARDRLECDAEHARDPLVGIVRLGRRENDFSGMQLPRDPQRLEVRHRAAAAQVAEVRVPADHLGQRRDRFLLHRNTSRSVIFGQGVHTCLGVHLARREMRIFFEELLRRLAWIEIAGRPTRAASIFIGGPKSLPVRFKMN